MLVHGQLLHFSSGYKQNKGHNIFYNVNKLTKTFDIYEVELQLLLCQGTSANSAAPQGAGGKVRRKQNLNILSCHCTNVQ